MAHADDDEAPYDERVKKLVRHKPLEPKRTRQERLGDELAAFKRSSGRKAQPGRDPNDRDYSVELQRSLRRMPAEEIYALWNGEPLAEKPE